MPDRPYPMKHVATSNLEAQLFGLSTLVQLGKRARHAATAQELAFVMVNETNALVPYRQALWVPLALDPGHVLGGLVLAREQPWSDGERHIVNELADSFAHAWAGFLGGRRRSLFAQLWGGRK